MGWPFAIQAGEAPLLRHDHESDGLALSFRWQGDSEGAYGLATHSSIKHGAVRID
jgi:hypothetical protein